MKKCEHKIVGYLGLQETLTKGKFLKLYQCLDCASTITLQKNKEYMIKDIIKVDPVKNILIKDITNILRNYVVEQINKETTAGLEHHFINLLTSVPTDASYLEDECKSQTINSKAEELSESTWEILTYLKDNSNYIAKETYETPEEQIAVILGNVYGEISNKVNKILHSTEIIKKEIESNKNYDEEISECINDILTTIIKTDKLLEKIKHGVPYQTEKYSDTINMLILPKPNKNQ